MQELVAATPDERQKYPPKVLAIFQRVQDKREESGVVSIGAAKPVG